MPIITTQNITPNNDAILTPRLHFDICQVQLEPIRNLQTKIAPTYQLPRRIWVSLLKPTSEWGDFNSMSFSYLFTDHSEAGSGVY